MRISAIQNCGTCRTTVKQKSIRHQNLSNTPEVDPKQEVAFKSNETIKGASIGALIGIGAVTILSGGAAAPIAYGIYAATMGTAGGMLGHAIEDINKNDKNGNNGNNGSRG